MHAHYNPNVINPRKTAERMMASRRWTDGTAVSFADAKWGAIDALCDCHEMDGWTADRIDLAVVLTIDWAESRLGLTVKWPA